MGLSDCKVGAIVAVSDMGQAKAFYEAKLGMTAQDDEPDGGRTYQCGEQTLLHIFPSPSEAGKSRATVAGWYVNDIESIVDELTANGVRFEQYDQPPLATDAKGIAVMGAAKGAWFMDPDGNTLGLIEM